MISLLFIMVLLLNISVKILIRRLGADTYAPAPGSATAVVGEIRTSNTYSNKLVKETDLQNVKPKDRVVS
jgi:hypothetical protein